VRVTRKRAPIDFTLMIAPSHPFTMMPSDAIATSVRSSICPWPSQPAKAEGTVMRVKIVDLQIRQREIVIRREGQDIAGERQSGVLDLEARRPRHHRPYP